MSPPTPPPTRRPNGRIPVVVYAHPFELALGVVLIFTGLRFFLEGNTSPAVDDLPYLPRFVFRVASLLGGVGVLVGLALRARAFGRTVERSACYLVAGAWSAYALLIGNAYGWSAAGISVVNTLAIAAACLARARAIARTERVILEQLEEANRDPDTLRRLVDGRPPEEDPNR